MAMKWYTKLEAAWDRCPIVFQGHLSNFKVTRDKQLLISTRIERFRAVTPDWIHPWLGNDAQSLMWYRRCALLFFKVFHQISRSRGIKKFTNFDPNWAFPDCNSKFDFTDGFEMMHKAWCSIEEVPYCFPVLSIIFQCHTGKISPILTRIARFRTVTPVWIHQWINKAWHSIEDMPYCFLGHPSNFKVTQAEKSTIWIQFEITRPGAAIKSPRFALFVSFWWTPTGQSKITFTPPKWYPLTSCGDIDLGQHWIR